MKVITKQFDEELYIPKSVFDILQHSDFCLIDIETLGLSRKFHKIILIGYLFRIGDQLIIKQLLAENPHEERDILQLFVQDMKKFNTFITYNGNAFDIPFLQARILQHSLSWDIQDALHMDLLIYIRRYQEHLKLENYRLKTVEGLLGITREDTISGKDSIELYKAYVKTRAPELEEKILLHNLEDIYYLSKLLRIFDFLPFVAHSFISRLHIEKKFESLEFYYNPYDFCISQGKLNFRGRSTTFKLFQEELHYHSNYCFKWKPSVGTFEFELTLLTGKLPSKEKYYYIDIDDFPIEASALVSTLPDKSILHQHYLIIDCKHPGSLLAIIELKRQLLTAIFNRIDSK